MARTRMLAALVLMVMAGKASAQWTLAPVAPDRPDPGEEKSGAAAPAKPSDDEEEMAKHVHAFFRINTAFGTTGSLSGGGETSVTRIKPGVTVLIPVTERSRMTVGLDYEYSHYDFEGTPTIIPGARKPWGDVHRETISANYFQTLDEKWELFGGAQISAAHEEGAEVGKSIEGGGYIGFNYAISKNLRIGPGFGVFSRLEDDPTYVPLVSVDWKIAKGWTLTNDRRPGLFLVYEPNEAWTFKAGAEWQQRDFRLSRSGPLPDGVARDQRVPISFEVEYDATRQIGLSARIGVDTATRYRTLDRDGNGVSETNERLSGFFSLGIVARF